MRRTAQLLLLAALALPAGARAATPPSLAARVAECTTSATADQRAAEFEGAMPATPGGSVLAMRFDLEQRRGGSWKPVAAVPGFGRYERSAPGAAGFVYAKRVERLAAGASYRVTVRFRWTDADGGVLKRATRHSASCRQDDLRPDLEVLSLAPGDATGAGRARYVLRLRNDGPSAVPGTVRIGLAVDRAPAVWLTVPGFAAGEERAVTLEGPACTPGTSVTATVDPGDAVDEPEEGDNARTATCPG